MIKLLSSSPSFIPMASLSVKALAESTPHSIIIPSTFIAPSSIYLQNPIAVAEDESIPVIDVSMLNSQNPNQRSKAVKDIQNACRDWGIFTVINHGVEAKKMIEMIGFCEEFFHLKEEEKLDFKGNTAMDSITYGSSVHGAPVGNHFLWRDFLKLTVHPQFHAPNKPVGFSEAIKEYCLSVRSIMKALLGGISESLGLDSGYIESAMNVESSFQLFAANFYPPCPQPELTMGIPPHTDHGLLTFLITNGVDGLQFKHNGKWRNARAPPGAFIVNVADHIEILSNGHYKSCVHRATVNKQRARISIAVSNGPSPNTVVGPLPEFSQTHPPGYATKKYREYVEHQFKKKGNEKSGLDHVKIMG